MIKTPATTARSNDREKGFTLVELMVVVAIIALLAAIVIPNYVHARAQAAVSQSEANIKQIATSLELYYADNQAYPASGTVNPALFGGATNSYLSSTPTNAQGHKPYAYTSIPGNGSAPSYTIVDPGVYDPSTLTALPTKGGNGLCTACTAINYDPQNGLYGV